MRKNKGFTLFEAVIAIAVVTLLAGTLAMTVRADVRRARLRPRTTCGVGTMRRGSRGPGPGWT